MKKAARPAGAGPVLLSGGNPQIPKGYGDAPVQAWIAAAPGWKGEVGARLDALIVKAVPGVSKAVKWNTPLYAAPAAEPDHWFLGFHAFDRYVKVSFSVGRRWNLFPRASRSRRRCGTTTCRRAGSTRRSSRRG